MKVKVLRIKLKFNGYNKNNNNNNNNNIRLLIKILKINNSKEIFLRKQLFIFIIISFNFILNIKKQNQLWK